MVAGYPAVTVLGRLARQGACGTGCARTEDAAAEALDQVIGRMGASAQGVAYRALLVAHYVQGRTLKELAVAAGVSESTMRVRTMREAQRFLQGYLEGSEEKKLSKNLEKTPGDPGRSATPRPTRARDCSEFSGL